MYVLMVFPTVLSTGVVDMDQFIPFMDDITNNFGNISQLMSIFDGVDVNDVITGGVALNGSVPGRLTGYYKYTSAVGGDNGGVLLIGTKYNQLTHRREVVGGGYAISLTDTSTFAPFEAVYSPLSDINPTSPYVEADSLVILLFPSANSSPQQGSILYLDNLQLWEQQEVIPEDTCSAIFNLSVQDVDTMHATLNWTYEGTPDDTTGIQMHTVNKLLIYPNLAKGQLSNTLPFGRAVAWISFHGFCCVSLSILSCGKWV